jgi:hypothetical protein
MSKMNKVHREVTTACSYENEITVFVLIISIEYISFNSV